MSGVNLDTVWDGMERKGMERNGMEWNGMEMERNRIEGRTPDWLNEPSERIYLHTALLSYLK